MGGAGADGARAADLLERLCGADEGPARVDHVVDDNQLLVAHVADDVHHLAAVGALAALIHNGDGHVQLLGEVARAGDGAQVRRDDDEVFPRLLGAVAVGEIGDEQGHAEQMVDRDVEKALNLRRVQVHCQNAVGSGGGDQVGDELGRDRVARLGLAVLAGVAEIGDYSRNPAGGGALERVDHDEQLHNVVVDGVTGGLDDEHVAAAHGFIDGNVDFAVGKVLYLALAEREPQCVGNLRGERDGSVRGENFDVFAMCDHSVLLLLGISCLFINLHDKTAASSALWSISADAAARVRKVCHVRILQWSGPSVLICFYYRLFPAFLQGQNGNNCVKNPAKYAENGLL